MLNQSGRENHVERLGCASTQYPSKAIVQELNPVPPAPFAVRNHYSFRIPFQHLANCIAGFVPISQKRESPVAGCLSVRGTECYQINNKFGQGAVLSGIELLNEIGQYQGTGSTMKESHFFQSPTAVNDDLVDFVSPIRWRKLTEIVIKM